MPQATLSSFFTRVSRRADSGGAGADKENAPAAPTSPSSAAVAPEGSQHTSQQPSARPSRWRVLKKSIVREGADTSSPRCGVCIAREVVEELERSGPNRIRTARGAFGHACVAGAAAPDILCVRARAGVLTGR
jgi:hypothetical protein